MLVQSEASAPLSEVEAAQNQSGAVQGATAQSGADAALAGFAPVGLAELNDKAQLLTRIDREYLLPTEQAARVLQQLAGLSEGGVGTCILEIDGLRAFRYESQYFDTPDRLSYHLTALKRRRRFKVRTRKYCDTGLSFIEVRAHSS